MQYTTSDALSAIMRVLPTRVHVLAVFCLVALALVGVSLEVSAGWLVWPPATYTAAGQRRQRLTAAGGDETGIEAAWWYVEHTWQQPCLQGLVLHLFCLRHGHVGPACGVLVPWLCWACSLVGLLWPRLGRYPEWQLVQRLATWVRTTPCGCPSALVAQPGRRALAAEHGCLMIGCVAAPSTVTVEQ